MATDDPRDEASDRPGPSGPSGPGGTDGPGATDETAETPGSRGGDTVERPPADPWAEETAIRPPAGSAPPGYPDMAGDEPSPADVPGLPGVGPTGTGVLPSVPPGEEPRWSARAQVRTPGVGDRGRVEHDEEQWVEPGRGPLTPILIAVAIILLLGLLGLGAYLLLSNRDDQPTTPTTTPAVTSAAPTSAAPTTTTTSAPPTTSAPAQVAIPAVDGVDYDTAAARLTAAGLVPKRVDETSNAPAGRVIGTNPPAGNVVARGTTIEIRVSKGLPTATPTPTPPKPTPTATAAPTG